MQTRSVAWFVIAAACAPSPAVDDLSPVVEDEPGDTTTPRSGVSCERHVPPPAAASALDATSFRPEVLSELADTSACLVVDDLDGDGHVDIAWGGPLRAVDHGFGIQIRWGNGRDGWRAAEVATPSPVRSCLVDDVDHDGVRELLVVGPGLLAVDGLTERAPATVVLATPDELDIGRDVLSTAEVDLDLDGDLDLVFSASGETNYCQVPHPDTADTGDIVLSSERTTPGVVGCLLRQDGGWIRPDDAQCPAVLRAQDSSLPFVIALADLNDDVSPEILVAGDFDNNVFAISSPSGWTDGVAAGLSDYNHAMGVAWADFDLDGLRDAYITDVGPNQVHRALDCTSFVEANWPSGVGEATRFTFPWGVVTDDFDADGDPDLFVSQTAEAGSDGFTSDLCTQFGEDAHRPPNFLLVNDGHGRFSRVDVATTPQVQGFDLAISRVATGDVDEDGDLDVVVRDPMTGIVLHVNTVPSHGHWLSIAPLDGEGVPTRSARVVVQHASGHARLGELWPSVGTRGWSETAVHFGLGDDAGPVDVSVRWPDGTSTTTRGVAVDQRVEVRHG